jgi:hypothetical protein
MNLEGRIVLCLHGKYGDTYRSTDWEQYSLSDAT